MTRLTKTQVIALFLSASNATFLDNLNALASAENVPEDQTLQPSSSGAECNGNADCTNENEVCAKVMHDALNEEDTDAPADANMCIQDQWCGIMGRVDNRPFFAACWETPEGEEEATQPDDVDATTYLAEIEDLITKETVDWDNATNLIVSPRFNYQDGWYIQNAADADTDPEKWVETDKAADNRCHLNEQCDEIPGSCCGTWPDQNNSRCFVIETFDGVKTSAGPVEFTPSCLNNSIDDVAPENAQDDIAAGALSEASEALEDFAANRMADAKTADGYDDKTDEEKAAWDEEFAAEVAEREEWMDELKELAGYDDETCDDACKAVVEEKLLEAEKLIYEKCGDDDTKGSVDCLKGEDLSKDEWAAKGKEYFTGSAEDRETKDSEWFDEKDAAAANIIALAPKPDADTEGGACGTGETKCGETLCCGSRHPKGAAQADTSLDGAIDAAVSGILGGSAATKYEGQEDSMCGPVAAEGAASADYTGAFDLQWTHVCDGAIKFAATVAAAGAAVYYM